MDSEEELLAIVAKARRRVGPKVGIPANVVGRKAYHGNDPEERLRLTGLTRRVGAGELAPVALRRSVLSFRLMRAGYQP